LATEEETNADDYDCDYGYDEPPPQPLQEEV
jgi:hypothetical protein